MVQIDSEKLPENIAKPIELESDASVSSSAKSPVRARA
jgi:hypothetical protein